MKIFINKNHYYILIITFLILSDQITYCQEYLPRIAVIPFTNMQNVSKYDAEIITGLFETALVNTEVFTVIEQNQIKEIIKVQKEYLSGCYDEHCAIEIGKLLSAEQIILGTLSAVEGKYILNVKIIDVSKGTNIRSDNFKTESLTQMTEEVDIFAYKLASVPDRLIELLLRKKEIEEKLANINKPRKAHSIAGWLSFGTGIVCLGVSGVFMYLANEAFNIYNDTNQPEKAIEYRKKTILYDTLMYSFGGAGGFGIGLSIILGISSPNANKYRDELLKIGLEIKKLKRSY